MSEFRQSENYQSEYLKYFNNFIQQLKIIFPSEETLENLKTIESYSDEEKIARGQKFCSSIREYLLDKEDATIQEESSVKECNFDLFLKSKIKVFSHKSEDTHAISESLFGSNFCLKNLLNNQPEDVKKIIWMNLHTLYMISELLKPDELCDQEKVMRLNRVICKAKGLSGFSEECNKPNPNPNSNSTSTSNDSSNPETKAKLQEMLGVDVNKETTSMIDDIVGSFEKVLTNQSNANPLAGIMEISQNISVKYADKINNGEIELDKLMQAITKKVPGMDQMMGGMMGSDGAPNESVAALQAAQSEGEEIDQRAYRAVADVIGSEKRRQVFSTRTTLEEDSKVASSILRPIFAPTDAALSEEKELSDEPGYMGSAAALSSEPPQWSAAQVARLFRPLGASESSVAVIEGVVEDWSAREWNAKVGPLGREIKATKAGRSEFSEPRP
jgi:hypothetical protein